MANTVQIRPELIKAGYTDADIGYDEGRKMTTLKGQDFLGAGNYTNVAGSTFTDRMNFDNALKKYNLGQQPLQVEQQPTPLMSSITSAGGSQPTTTPVNPADQRYNDLLNMLYQQAQNPQQVDVNAIYGSPQYAAYQAQAQRGADRGIRASQEALGSAGFGRSTTLGESAQRVQNEADAYLQTQVIPQLMAQEEARRRAQTQDQFSMLDVFMKQKDAEDRLRIQEAGLTGRLMSDQDRAAQPLLDELTRLGQAWQTASSPEEKMAYSQQADAKRAQLAQAGVDPSLYDPKLSTEQRMAAGQGLGTLTLGGREFAAKEKEAIAKAAADKEAALREDEKLQLANLWKAATETGTLPNGLADFYGLPRGTKTLEAARVGISQQSATTSRMNAELARTKYTDILGANEFSSQVISGLGEFDNAEDAQAWLNANGAGITKQVGYDKFLEMQKAIPTFFGKDTSEADAKNEQTIRLQAIGMAESDNEFSRADAQGKEQIIQEYITLIRGS